MVGGNMKFKVFVALLMAAPVFAAEVNGVKFEDSLSVNGKSLVLNGAALRTVVRFGFDIKVYVGALYLEKKTKDVDAIINSAEAKRIVMEYVRSVDRDSLVKGFRDGFKNNCVAECENAALFTNFKNVITSVKPKDRMIIDVHGDKVKIANVGSSSKSIEVQSAAFAKNMIAVFIGKIPPTADFKKGLLGN